MRIAIVNDVPMAAEALRRFLSSLPDHQVAWIAYNGVEAVERCAQDRPDLILMDLIMPEMDGVEATRRIMANSPCPILVVTSAVDGNSGKVFEALSAGALDAVQTPSFAEFGNLEATGSLKFKIDTLQRREANRSRRETRKESANTGKSMGERLTENLVAIGASAGGPHAVKAILSALPPNFPAGIVIVQHLDAQFVPLMAGWLNVPGRIPVRVAEEGDYPKSGVALLAGSANHLALSAIRTLGYTPEPRTVAFRPSIDVFFQSVARNWRGKLAAVLLTGMGRDGAAGLKAIRDAGALTIAQDAATCAVYGMPKAAAEIQAAMSILPVDRIAPELCNYFTGARPGLTYGAV